MYCEGCTQADELTCPKCKFSKIFNKLMITEDYVSFETAKLLKEKGFDVECDYLYVDGKLVRAQGCACNWNNGETLFTDYKNECSAPTIQLAMKWLREVHNLVVSVEPEINTDSELDLFYVFKIFKIKDTLTQLIYNGYELCDSYKEACEEAIRYTLENLI